MQLTITVLKDNKSGKKDWAKNGKSGTYTWFACGAQFAEHGDKWFNGFVNDFDLKAFGVQYPSEMKGKTVEVELSQEEYQGKTQDKFKIIAPKKNNAGGGLSDQDRETLIRLEKKIDSINWHIIEFLKAQKSGKPMYPSPEVEGIKIEEPPEELTEEAVPW